MIVENFEVKSLHGLIDAELTFRPDLNIIVGRNGSGKTSVLSMLSSVIKLDIASIKATQFNYLKVSLNSAQQEKICIEAENSDTNSYISINWGGTRKVRFPLIDPDTLLRPNIKTGLKFPAITTTGITGEKTTFKLYQQWSKISSDFLRLAKLTFVRLDRTIVAMDGDGIVAAELPLNTRERSRSQSASLDPIDEVLRVTRIKYLEYRRKLATVRAEAYRELMRLHFSPVKEPGRKKSSGLLKKKVAELRTRVNSSSLTSDMQEITTAFFESLDKLLEHTENPSERRTGRRTLVEESIQLMLELKERQTEDLLNIFEREQRLTAEAWEPIKKYLDTLERFLSESGKKLWFSDESLHLSFYIPGAGESEEGSGRSLKDLSSGERQIVIVLTYLTFMSGPNSVFIIDEPELSLHLRWQAYLIEALKTLRPSGGQIIIATHAPEIAGRAREYCQQLTQKYLPSVGGRNER